MRQGFPDPAEHGSSGLAGKNQTAVVRINMIVKALSQSILLSLGSPRHLLCSELVGTGISRHGLGLTAGSVVLGKSVHE